MNWSEVQRPILLRNISKKVGGQHVADEYGELAITG